LTQLDSHTANGVPIEVNPPVRIPRTLGGSAGSWVLQLLHKPSMRGMNGPGRLLKAIKNPVTDHLPPNTTKLTLSGDCQPAKLSKYLRTLLETVFVDAMARGRDDFPVRARTLTIYHNPRRSCATPAGPMTRAWPI
ncbi:EMG1/NEP1 methyltransferase-domain-containing protein, partial [Epithele typhae]|uniref:EMG1/NEP1 methyltransferase-domain-containing protein n=1 Tax=Epithele typhae TaxID=378194 RepID=UPI00200725B0